MGSSKKPKMEVPRYNMSIHYGVCHGPVDKVKAVYVGEKLAWKGDATGNTSVGIAKEDLFGGIKKEGGVSGTMEVLFGGPTQLVTNTLAERLGDEPENLPGFRGILSLFFRGGSVFDWGGDYGGFFKSKKGNRGGGFYWAAGNPYLKPIWVTVQDVPRELGGLHAEVPRGEPGTPGNYDEIDANAAHIIYACYTNTDWGMGESPENLDTASFLDVAETLFDERMGLSLQWTQSGTIEDFVNDILGHVNGVTYTHPRTGLITLKLMRDDYVFDDLRTVTPDNATVTSFARKAWGETSNEMKVSWTNPANEQEETVVSQDLGNMAMQGSLVSDSRNYHGVRCSALALRLADRELRMAASPLCSAEAELDRSFWDVTPYEVLRLDWPEYGLKDILVRVVNVSYGTRSNPRVSVSLVEDVFSLPRAAFQTPPGSSWRDPSPDPIPVSTVRVMPPPAYSLIQEGVDLSEVAWPSTMLGVFAPSPFVTGSVSYSVEMEQRQPSGYDEWASVMEQAEFAAAGQLVQELPAEANSVVPPFTNNTGDGPWADYFLIIGPESAPVEDLELALVTGADAMSGHYIVQRGVLDTVPQAWAAGTRVWSIPVGLLDPIDQEVLSDLPVKFRVTTNTPIGQTPLAEAPVFEAIALSRATRPLRPANVKLNGVGFAEGSAANEWVLTWSHRNRFLEDEVMLGWTEASTPLEDGVTYIVSVDVYDEDRNLLVEDALLENVGSVDTYTIRADELPLPVIPGFVAVSVSAVRLSDMETSWQALMLWSAAPAGRLFGAPEIISVENTTEPGALLPPVIRSIT